MARDEFQLPDGEEEIIDGFANKIGFWGGPGGKLILTNQRLIFTNRRKKKIKSEYNLEDVIFVSPARSATFWTAFLLITIFIKNAIRITFKGGESQRFVVNNKDRWIALIDEHRKNLQG